MVKIKYLILGFVKSNPYPGRSQEEIIDHSNANTKAIENVNINPHTVNLNNQNRNNYSKMNKNSSQNLPLQDKYLSQNYNGPLQNSYLTSNLDNFHFVQNETVERKNKFLKNKK